MSTETMNRKLSCVLPLVVVLLTALGCRQDMHDQAKLEPLEASNFFADGVGSRRPPQHTIAQGQLRHDQILYTGMRSDGAWADALPMELTSAVLARGQERYNIYCTPCHDWTGSGRGMIVQRGFKPPASYHEDRLRAMPVGYFFNVATNGFGLMSGYRGQITAEDRWAIAAWIRVLQRSQRSPLDSLPAADREALTATPDVAAAALQGDSRNEHGAQSAGEHAGAGAL